MTKHYCDNCGKELGEREAIIVQLHVFGPKICAAPTQYELCCSCLEEKCGPERVKRWYRGVRKTSADSISTEDYLVKNDCDITATNAK